MLEYVHDFRDCKHGSATRYTKNIANVHFIFQTASRVFRVNTQPLFSTLFTNKTVNSVDFDTCPLFAHSPVWDRGHEQYETKYYTVGSQVCTYIIWRTSQASNNVHLTHAASDATDFCSMRTYSMFTMNVPRPVTTSNTVAIGMSKVKSLE